MRISVNGAFAYVDYVIALAVGRGREEAIIYSCFDRSEIALRSFTANISLGNTALYLGEEKGNIIMFPKMNVKSNQTRMMKGKEPLNHAVSISGQINEKYLLTTKENRERDIYNYLMAKYNFPLLVEWVPYFLSAGQEWIKPVEVKVYGRRPQWAEHLEVYEMFLDEASLQELITNGLAKGGYSNCQEEAEAPYV